MKSLGIAQSIVYEMLYEKVKLSLAMPGNLRQAQGAVYPVVLASVSACIEFLYFFNFEHKIFMNIPCHELK